MTINWESQLGVEITNLPDASKVTRDSDDYYVYIIWKMYTSSPIPFYVGKGHWDRLIKHGMKSDAKSNSYKTNVFRKHEHLKITCGYSIFDFYKDEDDALKIEMELISLIGRYDLNQGPLTNRTAGGDGTRGHLAAKGGNSHSARPVYANGARYGCVTDAAKEFDISLGAITARINNGWEGYFYENEGQRLQTKKILGRYKKEVAVQGQEYLSASDASRNLDMDVRMICKRISYGWGGYYYLDQGQLPRKTIWGDRKDKVPVIVRGKKYSTTAEAVKAIGESLAMISKRCLSSNFPEYLRLDGKIIEKESPPKFPEEVITGSTYFESLGKAAHFFKLTDGGVAYRCRSENYPDWQFSNIIKQKKESFTPAFSSIPIQVIIDNISYESQSSGALAYNIDINTLKQRCLSFSFPTWECVGIKKVKTKDGKPGLIGVEIGGKIYRSVNEASKKLGVTRSTIKRRIKSDDWLSYKLNKI